MQTFFNNEKNLIPHIPANIFDRNQDGAWQDNGKIIYSCSWLNYAYHVEEDNIFIEFMWVHEAPDGFSFSTYHLIDEDLLSLLEAVRAINRFDARADLLALSSYEYDISFQKLDTGYVVSKIEPQDDSYHWNIKAFYDPIAVLSNLREQALRSARLPDASLCVRLKFAYQSEGKWLYSSWISAEMLKHEVLRYDIGTDTYRFCVGVGIVDTIKENFIDLHLCGVENTYRARIEYSDPFKYLLARIGAINVDGTICLENGELYRSNFEIILRKTGSVFEFKNLSFLHQKADGYWAHLMRLAELEQESNAE